MTSEESGGSTAARERPLVRLMNDYGAEVPLFSSDGAVSVSGELDLRLRAWQEHFEQQFQYERGWRATSEAAAHAAEGAALRRLLEAEIGRWADVELDLWPVTAR
jgi:hypothetical protein